MPSGQLSEMMVDETVATSDAAKSSVPGARLQNGPRVRAANTVRKSETEILRYIAIMSWPYVSMYGRPMPRHAESGLRELSIIRSRMTDEMVAMPPSTLAIAKTCGSRHFSGIADGRTASYAIEIMVPSLRIVMMTSAITGSLNDGGSSMSGSSFCQSSSFFDGWIAHTVKKKKSSSWIVHDTR